MPAITVRNLPDEVHRALRVQAAMHGRSTEAEIREILEQAVKPKQRIQIGDALAEIGRRVGLSDQDLHFVERDKTPAEPITLE